MMVVSVVNGAALRGTAVGVLVLLTACAGRPGPAKVVTVAGAPTSRPVTAPVCQAQAGSPLVGNWYATSRPKGVGGQFQSLTQLRADGTMAYETQLKIGKQMRPALRETGCWTYTDDIYTQQTLRSNGDEVDAGDPIYRNTYRVEKIDMSKAILRETQKGGISITARKMPDGYRLPVR